MTRVTATEAARQSSELLNRVQVARESFVVTRGGRDVCRIEPTETERAATVADLVDFLEHTEADEGFGKDPANVQKRQPKLPRSAWDS